MTLEDANGRECRHCHTRMPASDAIVRHFSVLAPDMYDRPASPLECSEEVCPQCDRAALEPLWLCERCWQMRPTPGSDYCAVCTAIVEREEFDAAVRARQQQRHRELIDTLMDIARPARQADSLNDAAEAVR